MEIKSIEEFIVHLLDRICDLEKKVFGQEKETPPIKVEAEE